MKKLLLSLGVIAVAAIVLVSCQGRTAQMNQVSLVDTTGLAEFQAFKAMQQQQAMMAAMAPQKEIVYVKQRAAAPAKQYSMNSESTNNAKVETKKKGWSKAAKYSVIGGVGGGVLGAVINKKDPVRGGIIGAVILGGGGYILGRSQDKKDGRVN